MTSVPDGEPAPGYFKLKPEEPPPPEKGDPGPQPGDYPEFDQTGDPDGPGAA